MAIAVAAEPAAVDFHDEASAVVLDVDVERYDEVQISPSASSANCKTLKCNSMLWRHRRCSKWAYRSCPAGHAASRRADRARRAQARSCQHLDSKAGSTAWRDAGYVEGSIARRATGRVCFRRRRWRGIGQRQSLANCSEESLGQEQSESGPS